MMCFSRREKKQLQQRHNVVVIMLKRKNARKSKHIRCVGSRRRYYNIHGERETRKGCQENALKRKKEKKVYSFFFVSLCRF